MTRTTARLSALRARTRALCLIGFLVLALAACSNGNGTDLGSADVPTGDVFSADGELPPAVVPGLQPGLGISVGTLAVRLGDARSQVIAALGAASSVRDLGGPGVLLSFASPRVACLVDGTGDEAKVVALYLAEGFEGRTEAGVGSGSSREAVRAEFGEPVADPFLGTWRHAAAGIAFDWEQDRVTSVTVFRPVP